MTKCVVSQLRNGQTVSQPTISSHTARITSCTTVLAVPQFCLSTIAATNAATAVPMISSSTGPMSRFQCGWRCSTTRSSAASTLSG